MICMCDICGRFFDTDYEEGTIDGGVTYCERCAIEIEK